jgi:hypothetical protein
MNELVVAEQPLRLAHAPAVIGRTPIGEGSSAT